MTVLVTTMGCRTIAKSLIHGLLGGDARYSSRGDPDEPGISRREQRRRFEEIHMRKTMSSPDWHWTPGE
jgi:hypothetical protein